jgi:hypothetical protein
MFGDVADIEPDRPTRHISDTKMEPVTVAACVTVAPDKTIELIGFDLYDCIKIPTFERRVKFIAGRNVTNQTSLKSITYCLNFLFKNLYVEIVFVA